MAITTRIALGKTTMDRPPWLQGWTNPQRKTRGTQNHPNQPQLQTPTQKGKPSPKLQSSWTKKPGCYGTRNGYKGRRMGCVCIVEENMMSTVVKSG